jgi:DNA-binding NarL/FixJ family response regulator
MRRTRTAELRGLPAAHTTSYVLAVISDDDTLAERAIAALEREGLQIRLEAEGTGPETLENMDRRPTLVIIRCANDRRTLERIVRRTSQALPGTIVVVTIPSADRPDVGLMLTYGAHAVVREAELEAVLGSAVRAAAAGHASAPAELLRAAQPPALSYRERQVLGLALAGLSNAQIAERLYLAPSTVKTHISAAFRRLGVHSRREATALIFATDDSLRRTVLETLRLSEEFASPGEELRPRGARE